LSNCPEPAEGCVGCVGCDGCVACVACTPLVARRAFVAQSTLAAVVALLAACGGDSLTGPLRPSDVNLTVALASYPALAAVGGIVRLDNTTTPIAVVRVGADSYRAFSMVCPHQGTTIAISGSGFRCPNHGATFSSTGAWTGGERTSGLFEFTVALNSAAQSLTITST
jgi:cytochrome b6-f complex iron-sulfur subunit